MAQQWGGGAAVNVGGGGGWGAAAPINNWGAAMAAAAAPIAIDDTDETTEREREEVAKHKRSVEWLLHTLQTSLSTTQQLNLIRDMAQKFGRQNNASADDMLRACVTAGEPAIRPSVRPLGAMAGRVTSVGDDDCEMSDAHLTDAMLAVDSLWYTHWGQIFGRTSYGYAPRDPHNEVSYRELWREDLAMFMGYRVVADEDFAPFVDFACLHRVSVAHLIKVLCCYEIDCIKAAVLKQTTTTGCAVAHVEKTRASNKFVMILGIKNKATGEWLDRTSAPVSCGVDVWPHLSGSAQDHPLAEPVRYDLLRQGDAMIIRSSRYKSRTVPPPAGFEVYKYIIWFNVRMGDQDDDDN
jgi:hypothetical protein